MSFGFLQTTLSAPAPRSWASAPSFLQVGRVDTHINKCAAIPKMSNLSHLCWMTLRHRQQQRVQIYNYYLYSMQGKRTLIDGFFLPWKSICLLSGYPISFTVPLVLLKKRPTSHSSCCLCLAESQGVEYTRMARKDARATISCICAHLPLWHQTQMDLHG